MFIQPELADVIKKVRICMVKQRMLYGYEDPGHLFVSQEGNRIGYASYNKYLKGIAEKTVPGKTVTPHTLRHTMTSLFAEAGVPLEAISRRLGHESSALTREIYLHITKETKVKTMPKSVRYIYWHSHAFSHENHAKSCTIITTRK